MENKMNSATTKMFAAANTGQRVGNSRTVSMTSANPLSRLNFTTIRPVSRLDLPLGRGRGRNAKLKSLKVVQEFNALLNQIVEVGFNPYEIVGEIDITGDEILAEAKKRKSFTQTFKKLLRESVKEHGLRGKIDVVEFNHGERFFVVGREI